MTPPLLRQSFRAEADSIPRLSKQVGPRSDGREAATTVCRYPPLSENRDPGRARSRHRCCGGSCALYFNWRSARAADNAAHAARERTKIQRQLRMDTAQPHVWVDIRADEAQERAWLSATAARQLQRRYGLESIRPCLQLINSVRVLRSLRPFRPGGPGQRAPTRPCSRLAAPKTLKGSASQPHHRSGGAQPLGA
jgi:hypothetical protein